MAYPRQDQNTPSIIQQCLPQNGEVSVVVEQPHPVVLAYQFVKLSNHAIEPRFSHTADGEVEFFIPEMNPSQEKTFTRACETLETYFMRAMREMKE